MPRGTSMVDLFSPIVFIDMDQVLADFNKAACEAFGVDIDKLDSVRDGHCWDLLQPLSALLGRKINEEEFWKTVSPTPEEGEEFWTYIDPLPWVDQLIGLVEDITDTWYVLSSPGHCHSAHSGKIKWLRKHFGSCFDRFILTREKYLLARPNTILIDDRVETVDNFRLCGGKGIVFPSLGNYAASGVANPVDYIENELRYYSHRIRSPW